MNIALHDRISRIINTNAFSEALARESICLFDFQAEWSDYDAFEALPQSYQSAILAGEEEMRGGLEFSEEVVALG